MLDYKEVDIDLRVKGQYIAQNKLCVIVCILNLLSLETQYI